LIPVDPDRRDVTQVRLFPSEAPAGGTRPGRRAFPGFSPGAPAPAVPPVTASRAPAARDRARPRPANARDVILRALQRPQNHIAVALAHPPPSPGVAGRGADPGRAGPARTRLLRLLILPSERDSWSVIDACVSG